MIWLERNEGQAQGRAPSYPIFLIVSRGEMEGCVRGHLCEGVDLAQINPKQIPTMK